MRLRAFSGGQPRAIQPADGLGWLSEAADFVACPSPLADQVAGETA
jgi:hypothetical protein